MYWDDSLTNCDLDNYDKARYDVVPALLANQANYDDCMDSVGKIFDLSDANENKKIEKCENS